MYQKWNVEKLSSFQLAYQRQCEIPTQSSDKNTKQFQLNIHFKSKNFSYKYFTVNSNCTYYIKTLFKAYYGIVNI